jgi:hypothetical protein
MILLLVKLIDLVVMRQRLDIFDLHSANPLGNIMIRLAYFSLISHDLYFGLGDGEILQDFHSSIALRVGMDKIW